MVLPILSIIVIVGLKSTIWVSVLYLSHVMVLFSLWNFSHYFFKKIFFSAPHSFYPSTETLVMRMLELLELSQILKDLFFFFNLFPFFCSVGQFVLIYLYWFILIYWTISLLNFFFIISILLLSPSKLIFSLWFYFLFLKLQFGSFHIRCFSNETVYPSIRFEGFCSDFLVHDCK